MLKLDYYFVKAGDNYCTVEKRKYPLSFSGIVTGGVDLRIVRELVIYKLKQILPFFKVKEFKFVCLDKRYKVKFHSVMVDKTTGQEIMPIHSTRKYVLYLMVPEREITMNYHVSSRECEIRYITYESVHEYR